MVLEKCSGYVEDQLDVTFCGSHRRGMAYWTKLLLHSFRVQTSREILLEMASIIVTYRSLRHLRCFRADVEV